MEIQKSEDNFFFAIINQSIAGITASGLAFRSSPQPRLDPIPGNGLKL